MHSVFVSSGEGHSFVYISAAKLMFQNGVSKGEMEATIVHSCISGSQGWHLGTTTFQETKCAPPPAPVP